MLRGLKEIVLSSRLWLSCGAVFMAGSLLLGYHQDQMAAEAALAHKTIKAGYSSLQINLFWVSLGMLGIGLSVMSFAQSTPSPHAKEKPHQVKANGAFPAMDPFQPIAGQDELGGDEDTEQKTSPLKSFVSKIWAKSRP